MPPKHSSEAQVLEQLEQVINKLQNQDADRVKEQKAHNFTIFMFVLSVLINGIAIKYIAWTTNSIYEQDKQISLLQSSIKTLENDISKLDAKHQQILSLIQSHRGN